jgi:hypothetical protein
MTTPTTPPIAQCKRCGQKRHTFAPKPEWGKVPDTLCSPCWSGYADARAEGTFFDFNDAFDNASDEQLAAGLRFRS